MSEIIKPVEVKRDDFGHWFHPDLPTFQGCDEAKEDSPIWEDWLIDHGLDICHIALEDENHPVYKRYWDDGDANITGWNPSPLEPDEGWFMLYIGDTEDGPVACFARPSAGEQP